jgi:hypothetical protein
MPLYKTLCEKCGEDETLYVSGPMLCNTCGSSVRRTEDSVVGEAPRLVGPTDTKPIQSEQLGKEFTSARGYERHLQERGLEAIEKGSPRDRIEGERIRHEADTAAQRFGYKNAAHYRSEHNKRRHG